jgi:hypothetical protein
MDKCARDRLIKSLLDGEAGAAAAVSLALRSGDPPRLGTQCSQRKISKRAAFQVAQNQLFEDAAPQIAETQNRDIPAQRQVQCEGCSNCAILRSNKVRNRNLANALLRMSMLHDR